MVEGDLPQLADLWNRLRPSQAPARCRGLRACQPQAPAGSRGSPAQPEPDRCLSWSPGSRPGSCLIPGLMRERVSRGCPSCHHSGACGSSFSSHLLFHRERTRKEAAPFPNLCLRAPVHPLDPTCKLDGAGEGFCEPRKASVIRWEALKTNPRCYVMMGGHKMSPGFCHLGMTMGLTRGVREGVLEG